MSNDLISRNEVIKAIDELGYVNCHDGKDFEANSRVDKIRQRIVEMPTAYDVDKVVKRLEEMRSKIEEQLRTCTDNDMADYLRCKISAIAEIIEIVKSGSTK